MSGYLSDRGPVPGGWIYYGAPLSIFDPTQQAAATNHILAAIAALQQEIQTMSGSLQASIDQLIADNATLKADVDAAPASIATLVATAIAGAVNAGATPAQLQSMADLHTALGGEHTALTAALAGTAPAPAAAAPAPAAPAAPTP